MNRRMAGRAIRLELLRALARNRELEQQVRNSSAALERANDREHELRASVSFTLGATLVRSMRSPLSAPGAIAELLRKVALRRRDRLCAASGPTDLSASSQCRFSTAQPCQPVVVLEAAQDRPELLADLRVAAVLDTFSQESFKPNCRLTVLGRDTWATQILDERPHLLLVESAWRGANGQWEGQVSPCSSSLRQLVASCRAANIPTVFWNKEDPLHFEAFIEAAALFDVVFTTDADCIPMYRRELKHNRVYCMPFALQPAMFRPVGKNAREPAFFFAGAYYAHLPERAADFHTVADALRVVGPLHVYDRNQGQSGDVVPGYPEEYRPFVRAAVSYDRIAELYRRYAFGVNLNTIKQSPTMFARRVFELVGSGCITYGNFSLGVRRMLGDLVVATDDQEQLFDAAWLGFDGEDGAASERRTRALRKVLDEHTCEHRLSYLCKKTFGWSPKPAALPEMVVVSCAQDEATLRSVIASFECQRGIEATLAVQIPGSLVGMLPDGAVALTEAQLRATPYELWGDRWIAPFHPRDAYGERYLRDIALAAYAGPSSLVGKAAFRCEGRSGILQSNLEFREVTSLALRRSAFRAPVWSTSLGSLLSSLDEGAAVSDPASSIDAQSYLQDGAGAPLSEEPMDDGVSLSDLLDHAEALPPAPDLVPEFLVSGAELACAFNQGDIAPLTSATTRRHRLELCSLRRSGLPTKIISRPWAREAFEREGRLQLCLDAQATMAAVWHLEGLNRQGHVVGRARLPPQVTVAPAFDDDVVAVRLTVELDGPLIVHVDGLHLRSCKPMPLLMCGRGRLLVVTNAYPSREHAYRNAFVHRRVVRYRRQGVRADVIVCRPGSLTRSYDFEGVTVTQCDGDVLAATLEHTRYDAIAVHFLDRDVWRAICQTAGHTRTVVWIHGAEIQPWTRRAFNYSTAEALAHAQRQSDDRQAFWRGILSDPPAQASFVFVSETFAGQCWEDLGLRLPQDRWQVIHNPIDTDLFGYAPKSAEQRLHILSVRPHASRIYANDLVAQTIDRLSTHPDFPRMRFTLVGDGQLWDENFAGVRKYPNVDLQRRFVRQVDIPEFHRNNGVFLVPTRGDTQGVSRDEAMASGLVPVTCDVGAVAEFVDDRSGILCPPEDPDALAFAVAKLVEDPEGFLRLSRGAAERVRRQSGADAIAQRELEVLGLASGSLSECSGPDNT